MDRLTLPEHQREAVLDKAGRLVHLARAQVVVRALGARGAHLCEPQHAAVVQGLVPRPLLMHPRRERLESRAARERSSSSAADRRVQRERHRLEPEECRHRHLAWVGGARVEGETHRAQMLQEIGECLLLALARLLIRVPPQLGSGGDDRLSELRRVRAPVGGDEHRRARLEDALGADATHTLRELWKPRNLKGCVKGRALRRPLRPGGPVRAVRRSHLGEE